MFDGKTFLHDKFGNSLTIHENVTDQSSNKIRSYVVQYTEN